MQVFRSLEELPRFDCVILTIGTFDGVHSGHKTLVQRIVKKAHDMGGTSVLLTFEPHPRQVLFPNEAPPGTLTTLEEKIEQLSLLGVHVLVVVPFTKAFAQMEAEDYIKSFLVKHFAPHTIVIGYDHHFGHDRRGNLHLLKSMQAMYNFVVEEIPKQELDNIAISSTQIRNALADGDVKKAAGFLQRFYSFKGTVVHGERRGRLLGFPTANLVLTDPNSLLPKTGVYAVRVVCAGMHYKGMMNIGSNPTFSDEVKKIEVHLFDTNENLYGKTLQVFCVARLRGVVKFSTMEDLVAQLHEDKKMSLIELADA